MMVPAVQWFNGSCSFNDSVLIEFAVHIPREHITTCKDIQNTHLHAYPNYVEF